MIDSEIRAQLKQHHHTCRERRYGWSIRFQWVSDMGMSSLDHPMITPTHKIDDWELHRFGNKATTFYWANTAQETNRCGGAVAACIYKGCFRCHDYKPNIELGHFFANAIRITPNGPGTVAGIVNAHKTLCDRTSVMLEAVRCGEYCEAGIESCRLTQYHKLLPLCRAIIVIYDTVTLDFPANNEGCIHLDDVIEKQNVLLVLTGDQRGLSAPVDLDTMKAQVTGQALTPPTTAVTSDSDIDMVRVSMWTAMQFINDLERREESVFPDLGLIATDRSMAPISDKKKAGVVTADDWAEEIMQEASEKGTQNVEAITDAFYEITSREEQGESRYPQKVFLSPSSFSWI